MTTYNIIYDKTLDLEQLKSSIESTGAAINKTFPNIGVINLTSDNLDFTSVDGVVVHEEDLNIQVMESTTEAEWHQRRIISLQLPMKELYMTPNQGEGIIVYLVDTAIDTTHPEFINANITNFWSHDDTFDVPNVHGTSIASLIVGDTVGISPKCNLKSVVIPTNQNISISVLISAFDAIIADHDQSVVSVVNCSWVIQKSQILDTKILELQSDNLVVVAAAGNDGDDADNYSPVGLNSVLGVGASDAYDRVISWSSGSIMNYGEEVDITAPGIDIKVANSNDGSYRITSGTSLSCAITSAVVAQYIYEKNINDVANMNAQQIQNLVVEMATDGLLFRDEIVYQTTPNKILYLSEVQLVQEQGYFYYVMPGETLTVELTLHDFVKNLNFEDIKVPSGRRWTLPNHVTVSGDRNSIVTFSPPDDMEVTTYPIRYEILDDSGLRMDIQKIQLFVYKTEEDKSISMRNISFSSEIYEDESGNVFVREMSSHCGNYTCSPYSNCTNQKGCDCTPCSATLLCLHYDMKVMVMAQQGERGLVSVEDVRVGDMIEAYDGYTKVTKVVTEHMREGYYIIDNDLKITNDHPFLHNDNWITAEEYDGAKRYIEEVVPTVYISTEAGNFVTYNDSDWVVDGQYGDEHFS